MLILKVFQMEYFLSFTELTFLYLLISMKQKIPIHRPSLHPSLILECQGRLRSGLQGERRLLGPVINKIKSTFRKFEYINIKKTSK